MTREERLKLCKVCQNRKFNPQLGLICGLTNEVANFEDECPGFSRDPELAKSAVASTDALLDNSARARIAIIVLALIAAISLIAFISDYFEYELLTRIAVGSNYTELEADSNDARQGIIGIFQVILAIVSIFTFLNWFRRAYGNLHRMNIPNLEYSEKMTIWSFMIPFINLVRPFQIAKEIATETRGKIASIKGEVFNSRGSYILGIWWALFLISRFMGRIAARVKLNAETVDELSNATQLYLFSDLLDIPAAIAAILMIRYIAKDEKTLFEVAKK